MDDSTPIEIVVYFHDNSGIMLKIQDGQNMEANILFEYVAKELNLQAEVLEQAKEVFSLWLVSDLLELQLKPNHVPFKLVCFWEELLEKYVHCSEEARQRDEPIIMFRRNVYVSPKLELQIQDERLLKFLFHETKKNVTDGRLPLSSEQDYIKYAALHTHIFKLEKLESAETLPTNFATPAFFKFAASVSCTIYSFNYFSDEPALMLQARISKGELDNMKEFLPSSQCKRNLLFRRDQNPEFLLFNRYQSELASYENLNLSELYMKYLEVSSLFTYGAAYFRGQIEHPGKKVDDPVWVAVSLSGVTIVCITDEIVLLRVPFTKLSWQFAEPTKEGPNVLPCLFLHFPFLENNQSVTKLLQIFSKSAMLIDNLIEALISVRRSGLGGTSSADTEEVSVKEDRLAFVTYNTKGEKIRSTIRIPKESAAQRTSAAV
ncbi:hypothetical protein HELRODRAFT_162363 [Helobdella robusta]|uniref:FERM domain-containing protein 8 n=1 Tax=Helobdella robusta TaxID=6412 RepID=T1ESK4_HELRO|nr:hypothetical protein HELRODRAFT_162363 [Helobdella robusta]ESN98897.1 hypothetical protein HELRODRAFT_162363 [Helobdella robusta]